MFPRLVLALVARFRPRALQPGLSWWECGLLAFAPLLLWFVPSWRRGWRD